MKKLIFLALLSPNLVWAGPLAAVLEYTYGPCASTRTFSNGSSIITSWNCVPPEPDKPQIATDTAVYDIYAARVDKKDAVKAEGLRLIQVYLPGVENFEKLQLVREQWLSTAPAARSATATFQYAINVYQAGTDAIGVLNGYTTLAEIEAYNPVSGPSWPATP